MSKSDFSGKTALVTGGGRGIGEQCVQLLLERGANVAIVDEDLAQAQRVAKTYGNRAIAIRADVGHADQCLEMVAVCVAAFGRLDVALNMMGASASELVDTHLTDLAVWRRLQSVNVDGIFHSMRAQLPELLKRESAAIVNLTSTAGVVGVAGAAAYTASKHAIVGLTRAAAAEYAARGIRINVLAHGVMETAETNAAFVQYPQVREAVLSKIPQARLGKPAEVAELAMFLASDMASFSSGGVYVADGGATAI